VKRIHRLLGLEPFWILLLGLPILLPGKLVPLPYHPYVVAALFLFWPFRWFRQLRRNLPISAQGKSTWVPRTPLTIPILGMLCWLPVNLSISVDANASWIATGYLLFGVSLYAALINWAPARSHPWYIAASLLCLISGLSVVSLPIVDWKDEYRLFYLPLYDQLQALPIDIGETIHANILAGMVVIGLPLLIALSLRRNWTKYRWLWLICLGTTMILLAILILTQSRGGYLAIAVALPLIVLLCWPYLLRFVPVGVLLLLGLIYAFGNRAWLELFSVNESTGGWNIRLEIWQYSFQALYDFVFTGIGIGTFATVMPRLYPLSYPVEEYPHAHNLFFQVGIDLGIPGLIVYLALIMNLWLMLIGLLRTPQQNGLTSTLTFGATGSLAAMLVHGLLDAATWGVKLAFVPWVLFALITLLFLESQENRSCLRGDPAET
jgi:putative inorganic carbon (HCO3(-)) transporter